MPSQSDCVDAVKSSMIAAQRLLYKSILRETNHEKTRTHRHHIHACPFRLQHHFRRRQRCERSRQRRKQCRSGCERQNVRHSAVRKNKTAQVYRLGGFVLHGCGMIIFRLPCYPRQRQPAPARHPPAIQRQGAGLHLHRQPAIRHPMAARTIIGQKYPYHGGRRAIPNPFERHHRPADPPP